MANQFKIVSWDEAAEQLEKAHVKAHFRRDPKSGKLHFIKDYDTKVHGKADHTIHAGTKMLVNNPKSKHHGKVAHIKGYVQPNNPKKKPYVTVTVDGVRADLKPHHFKDIGPHHAPAPSIAALSPTPAATKTITTLDEAKKELGVVGLSWNNPEMQHEEKRIGSMRHSDLVLRVRKIKNNQKLYNYYRAVERSTSLGQQAKAILLRKIEEKLIEQAQLKTGQAPKSAPQSTNAPQGVQPTTQPPKSPPGLNHAIKIGDIVDIQTGKYAGKKGKVTHIGGKYGVRVRVDLAGNGEYTKIAEYKKPHVSFKGVAQADPASLKSDNTRGKDKKKRKERSDKGTGQPEKQIPEKKENILDYANDNQKAYELAPDHYRDIAHSIGILPLDDDTRNMMDKALHKLAKYYNKTSQGANKLPKWVKYDHGRTRDAIGAMIGSQFFNSDAASITLINYMKSASKADWEKAGWDYEKDIKPAIDKIEKVNKEHESIFATATAPRVLNELFKLVASVHHPDGELEHKAKPIKDAGISVDTPLIEALKNDAMQKAIGVPVDPEKALSHACVFADIDPKPDTTIKDVIKGLYLQDLSRDKGGVFERIRSHAGIQELNEWDRKNRSARRHFNDLTITTYDDGVNWHESSRWNQKMPSSGDIFEHLLGIKKFPTDEKYYMNHATSVFEDKSTNVFGTVTGTFGRSVENDPDFKHFMENTKANMIARFASMRYSNAGAWKPAIFDKDMIKDLGHEYAGLTAGRRKGTTDINVEKLAAKYVKERKKKAKQAAAAKDKGMPESVKATMKKVDQKTHDEVVKRISQTWDKNAHGSFGFKVHGVYQVGGMELYKHFHKINKDRDNEQFSYHGTDVPAAANIIRTEFRIDRVKAGRMLGDGVYLTRTSSKASQYLGENFTRHRGTRGVLFVNKVSMGKVHDRAYGATNNEQKERSLNGNHPDYHTAHTIYAPKGKRVPGYFSALVNDEYLIKNNKAVLPMYWVDIELI